MDTVSHALIGAIIAQFCLWRMDDDVRRRRLVALGAIIAAAPDIGNILPYLHLGAINDRFLWIPYHSDWEGYRSAWPWMVIGWEVTHSLLIAAGIGYWLYSRGYSLWPAFCWASHSLVDIMTHTGEWSSVPFWPFYIHIEGFSDPWMWSPTGWVISNLILIGLLVLVSARMEGWRQGWPDLLLPLESWSHPWMNSHDTQG